MNIFNSLGSNYDIQYILKSLLLKEEGGRNSFTLFLEKKYIGQAILFYKARQAITQALLLSKLPEGSKVAVSGFTCFAVVKAVQDAGCTPIFLDIEKDTLNFTAEELEKAYKKYGNIRGVIIQNTLGNPCDIEEILKVCRKYNMILIEDLAHSIGVTYKNRKEAGRIGDFTVLSFSQDKVVDGVSGGALIIKNSRYKTRNRIKAPSSHPSFQDKYYPLFTWIIRKLYPLMLGKVIHMLLKTFGLLSNPMSIKRIELTDWHAMLALEEFRAIEKNLSHRRKIAKIYHENLTPEIISKNFSQNVANSASLRFPIFIEHRDNLLKKLESKGIHISDTWYDTPIGPKKYFKKSGYRIGECPNSEAVSKQILNLPTHKNVSEHDALKICQLINSWEK